MKDSLIFKSLYLKKWNVSKKNLTANMLLYYLMLFLKPPLYKKYNSINMNKSLERSLILKWIDSMGVYFSVWPPPPPKKNDQIACWGKKIIKRGWKKKCIFFPHLVKSMHIFSPIDLKYKLWQISIGEKISIKKGGGKNMNCKFKIHPW